MSSISIVLVALFLNTSSQLPTHIVRTLPSDLLRNSMDIEFTDLNGDGHLDAVVAVEYYRNLILYGNGKGEFTVDRNAFSAKNYDSEDVQIADFDRDEDLDVIFVSEDNQVNEYYRNRGDGLFEDISDTFPVSGITNGSDQADVDGDSDIDLLLGNAGQNQLLLNDGKGQFVRSVNGLPDINDVTQDVEFGDLDGDGDHDAIIANEDANYLLINDGKGQFSRRNIPLRRDGKVEMTREADFGDIDGDGDLDLFHANVAFRGPGEKNWSNRILINDGNGQFKDETETRLIAANEGHTVDVDFVDLDGDTDIDVVLAGAFGSPVQILINENGVLTDQTIQYTETALTNCFDVEIRELNGDGIPDIYIGVFQGVDQLLLSAAK